MSIKIFIVQCTMLIHNTINGKGGFFRNHGCWRAFTDTVIKPVDFESAVENIVIKAKGYLNSFCYTMEAQLTFGEVPIS